MKNYTGAICYNEKPFDAFLSMFKSLKSSKIHYHENTQIRFPMRDIIQRGRPVGIKYNEETETVIEAKIRIPLDETTNIDYMVRSVGGELYVV